MSEREKLRELIVKWRTFADTDYTKGMKLSDSKKQGQYELMMAGQSLAYATAAGELEAALAQDVQESAPESTIGLDGDTKRCCNVCLRRH